MAGPMPESIRRRFEAYEDAPLTWHDDDPLAVGPFSWHDVMEKDLGADPLGSRFDEVASRMLEGRYYPPDALEFFGPWQGGELRPGDRILQRARLLPFLPWPVLWAMTEVTVAHRDEKLCQIGYVTTRRHFGQGTWAATLRLSEGRLSLLVEGFNRPGSWLFWLGLPYARYLQKRAWRRAVEEFRKVGTSAP